jgi:hypothetical protein
MEKSEWRRVFSYPKCKTVKTSQNDQSVVIVGNGASLLKEKLGSFIDSYDIVVRFNLFNIDSFAPYVGTKTNVWFNNRNAHSPHVQSLLKKHVFQQIYIHTWYETAAATQSFQDYLKKISRETPVAGIDKSTIDQMCAFLGERYRLFSTGAIGVWIMLQHYSLVTLVGFDWWNNPDKFHYNDNSKFNGSSGKGHQPQLEKIFFDKLAAEGRLKFMSERN